MAVPDSSKQTGRNLMPCISSTKRREHENSTCRCRQPAVICHPLPCWSLLHFMTPVIDETDG